MSYFSLFPQYYSFFCYKNGACGIRISVILLYNRVDIASQKYRFIFIQSWDYCEGQARKLMELAESSKKNYLLAPIIWNHMYYKPRVKPFENFYTIWEFNTKLIKGNLQILWRDWRVLSKKGLCIYFKFVAIFQISLKFKLNNYFDYIYTF